MCWHNMASVVDNSNTGHRSQVGLHPNKKLGGAVYALTSSWSAQGNANKSISSKDVNTNNVLAICKSRAQLHVHKFPVK